jgi:hypothetical protein
MIRKIGNGVAAEGEGDEKIAVSRKPGDFHYKSSLRRTARNVIQ